MKELSSLRVLIATLAFIVASQAFCEEETAANAEANEDSVAVEKKGKTTTEEKERDYDFYISISSSNFREDIGSAFGSGESFRITFGYQFRKWFGVEMYEERAPALETKSILADLRQSLDEKILDYFITTQGNWFGGTLATFSYELNEAYTLVTKVGIAKYEAHRIAGRLTLDAERDNIPFTYLDLDREVEGYTPIFSLGLEMPFPYPDSEKTTGEVMLVHMADKNVESLSLRLAFKYTF